MSNISNSIPQSAANPFESNTDSPSASTVTPLKDLKKIDLSSIQSDKSLSLHKLLEIWVTDDSFVATIKVLNLSRVYISDEASAALERSYITPAFILDRFASQYKANVLVEITRGSLKGTKYINTKVNEYSHPTKDGIEIVVTGKCVERDKCTLREIHITCRSQTLISTKKPNRRKL